MILKVFSQIFERNFFSKIEKICKILNTVLLKSILNTYTNIYSTKYFKYKYKILPGFGGTTLYPGMEITGIASQFAMQSRPICDASSMRRNNYHALLGYSTFIFVYA